MESTRSFDVDALTPAGDGAVYSNTIRQDFTVVSAMVSQALKSTKNAAEFYVSQARAAAREKHIFFSFSKTISFDTFAGVRPSPPTLFPSREAPCVNAPRRAAQNTSCAGRRV